MTMAKYWKTLAERLREIMSLLRTCENPPKLSYNHVWTTAFIEKHPDVKLAKAFDSTVGTKVPIQFVEFVNAGCWEVHFFCYGEDRQADVVRDGVPESDMLRIYGAVLTILERKLADGLSIRYYSKDVNVRLVYDKFFGIINSGIYEGLIRREDIIFFRTFCGEYIPAVVLKLGDKGSPKLDRTDYFQTKHMLSSVVALMNYDDDWY